MKDSSNATANTTLTLTVVAPTSELTITTSSIPSGFSGVVYPAITVVAQGGTPPYNWSATGLPSGLILSTGGTLSGTLALSAAGSYQVTVTVTDSSTPNPLTATRTLTGTIGPPPSTLLTVSPLNLSFSYVQGDPNQPSSQNVGVFSNPSGAGVTVSAQATGGGTWLTANPTLSSGNKTPGTILVSVNPAQLAAGVYNGQVTVSALSATPPIAIVQVSLTVIAVTPPQLSISSSTQSIALTQGSPPVQGQIIVSNIGAGTLQFTSQASSDGNWLALAGSSSGTVTPSSPASLPFTINPGSGLAVGLHRGQITITNTPSGAQEMAAVTLLVNAAQQTMQLSHSGLTFNAVASAAALPSQTLFVFNQGLGSMAWTIQTQTLQTGQAWLRVDTPSGVAMSGEPGQTEVFVNQTGLSPGQYYGTVTVSAPGAVNSPQTVSVLLNVVQAGQLGSNPTVSTAGEVLTVPVGSSSPVTFDVSLFNPAGTGLSYSDAAVTLDGGNWLSVSQATGSLNPAGTGTLTVQANPANVPVGVGYGSVRVAFSEGTVHTINVAAIAPSATLTGTSTTGVHATKVEAVPACQAKALVVEFQAPEQSQFVQVAQAENLKVHVVDTCGTPLTASNGAVVVTFSNNDAPVKLVDSGGGSGVWVGSWNPVNAQVPVKVQANAFGSTAAISVLQGDAVLDGLQVLPANTDAAAQPLGALNAASLDTNNVGLVVPGSYVAIYGARLADSTAQPNGLPLPVSLGDTQLFMGNQPLPLSFASETQVNGLVPQGLPINTSLQLSIQRGSTGSVPVTVTVTDLQPGIFTITQKGSGQGAILVAGTGLLAGPAATGQRPAQRGETVEIYATGLGAVLGPDGEAPLPDGVPAPSNGNPLYGTVASASVTIGGVNAPVSFAGLAPSFVGLYQVNAQVPANSMTGDAVQLILTMTGQNGAASSPPVTIAVQ